MNIDKKIYVQSSFTLPSATPEHPMSKYIVRWDPAIESYKISLRRNTYSRLLAWQTYTRDDAHSEILQADTCHCSSNPSNASEPAINMGVSGAPLEAAAQATEKEEPTAIADHASTMLDKTNRVAASDSNGPVLGEASPALSPNTTCNTTLSEPVSTSTAAQELGDDGEFENFSTPPVNSLELSAPGTPHGAHLDGHDSFLESPVKPYQLSRPDGATPARASGLQYDLDDSLLDSPVKACNIVRPGAPTPGRARTRYMRDSGSEEGESFVVPQKSDVNAVFSAGEASFTCSDESKNHLPNLDLTDITPSISVVALDLGFTNNTATIRPHIDWLHLILEPEYEDIVNDYDKLSEKSTRQFLQEAVISVSSLNIRTVSVPQVNAPEYCPSVHNDQQAMDIDLDAIFGGQGATDLEDDESVERSPSMAPVQVASTITPEESSIDIDNEPEESRMDVTRPSVGYHLNCLGNEILLPSNTPAIISLFVQVAATRKAYLHPWSREGVILAQANRYVDAVAYYGHLDYAGLHALRGSSFEDQSIGYALKVNDPQGSFCDPYHEGSVIMDFEKICDHYMVQDGQSNLQRPYQFNHKDHQYTPPKVTSLRFCAPTTYYTKRDPQGFIQHWIKNVRPRSFQPFSSLWMIESADDQSQDDACSTLEAEISNKKGELFALAEEAEEAEEEMAVPCHVSDAHKPHPTENNPLQADVSRAELGAEEGFGSGSASETDLMRADECPKSDEDDKEYSPFDPCIPGLRAAHEDWHPEEMPQDQALRRVDDLLERAFGDSVTLPTAADNDIGDVSIDFSVDDSYEISQPASEEIEEAEEYRYTNEDEHQHRSGDSSSEKNSDEEKPRSSRATTPPSPVTSPASSLFFSPISIVYDCPPCVVGTTDKPAITEAHTEPTTPESTEQPSEQGLSKYAAIYAAVVIGAGILLSLW